MSNPNQSASRLINPAISFMIGAGCLIAVTSIIAKSLGVDTADQVALNPLQVSAGRFCFAFLCLVFFVSVRKQPTPLLTNANWKLHLGRSLFGWLGVTTMFTAVAQMPVGEAVAISFLSPIVTMGLAVVLLGEYIGFSKLVSVCVALVGALLILKPGTDAFQTAGLWALASAGLMGLEAIFIKKLSDTEPAIRVLFLNNAIGACVSLAAASVVWVWPDSTQWVLLVTLGTIMVCGQTLFIQSMKRGEASLVMPAFYSVLIFATIFDLLLYEVLPDWFAISGMLLIVLSALILGKNKTR